MTLCLRPPVSIYATKVSFSVTAICHCIGMMGNVMCANHGNIHLQESLKTNQHTAMLPDTVTVSVEAPGQTALYAFDAWATTAFTQHSHYGDPHMWPGSPISPVRHPYAAQLHASPAKYSGGPETLTAKISRSFRRPSRAEPQVANLQRSDRPR